MTVHERESLADAEECILRGVVSRLKARIPLESWPSEERQALALALAAADTAPSQWQADALRRHLLSNAPIPPELTLTGRASDAVQWAADRLRADLAGLVPFRALRRG